MEIGGISESWKKTADSILVIASLFNVGFKVLETLSGTLKGGWVTIAL